MNIFKSWVFILAFVSSQLAWNLRPFVGSKDLPFELFRVRKGNFYIAVIHSIGDLFQSENKKIPTNETEDQETDSSTNDTNE